MSKIKLIVKEGPGVIIGIDELELIDNKLIFEDIQLSDPGNYIISIIPSDNTIEGTEFSISVEEEEIIPQENSDYIEEDDDKDREEPKGSRPCISQITQPTIDLEPISFSASDNEVDNREIGSSMGLLPVLWYNGVQISPRDIKKLFLYYEDNIPKCRATFIDSLGVITSQETTPISDTTFEVFLNSGTDILKSIHLKFKMEINKTNKNGSISIKGTLDINDYYKEKYGSYKGTSYKVLKKISKELGLGFNSNINNTDDEMAWNKKSQSYGDFIKEITRHSFISDSSFTKTYIDYYYSLNYVDLEKEWNRDIDNDLGLNTTGISSADGNDLVPLVLTNDNSENTSSFFFSKFKPSNNSTLLNKTQGIFTSSKVYDRNKRQFLKFDIDSLTSNRDDVYVLKGSPRDKDQIKTNYVSKYNGKINTDNVHKNYQYAVEQNNRNLLNLSNIVAEASLPNPNFNLYLYQKVRVFIINQNQSVSKMEIFDERLSGEWIIIDISYNFKMGKLIQKVKIARKELGKTKKEINNQETENENVSNNSEINDNPTDLENESDLPQDENDDSGFDFGNMESDTDLIGEEYREVDFDGLSEQEYELQENIADAQEESNNSEPIGEPVDVQRVDSFDSLLRLSGKLAREFGKNERVKYENLKRGYTRGIHGLCPQGTLCVLAALTGVKSFGTLPGNADWFSFKTPTTGGGRTNLSNQYYKNKEKITQINGSWRNTYMQDSNLWQIGDVVASGYSSSSGKKYGHIQIWTGYSWMSDFKQNTIQQRNLDTDSVALWRLNSNGISAVKSQSGRLINADSFV